ncbi:MAG: ribonuclease P protein component [Deltaproteobacteria bacterium]|nr:ribonuclease P protein component [Deltaproteobacteria bacterium]
MQSKENASKLSTRLTSLVFTKEERLHRAEDFSRTRKKGKKTITKNLFIYSILNDKGLRRIGLSVSRRVGNSPKRARTKRLLREFFRQNKEVFPESSDILVVVKSGRTLKNYESVKTEITEALCKEH